MGVEGDNYSPGPKIDVDKVERSEEEDVVEKETKLRTSLEKELEVKGAVEVICFYLTTDAAPMVTADDVRRTLDRKGMSLGEVERILRDAQFRRVLAWELDAECARLARNLEEAGDEDKVARREALDRQKNLPGMQDPAIKEGFSVWARPEGKEKAISWTTNNKSLSEAEITELVVEHIRREDEDAISWF